MENTKGMWDRTTAAIQALDLEQVKRKLMDEQKGQGWTREQADYYETEYKKFLTLIAKHPNELIAPANAVDKFWHGHILDTKKYAEDCDRVFGYFLHHFPYFGMRGKEDAENLVAATENTKRFYEQEFGAGSQLSTAYCGVAAGSYCGVTEASYCGAATASYCSATEASFCVETEFGKSKAVTLRNSLLRPQDRPSLAHA